MKIKRILKGILKWTSLAILLALFVGIIALFIAYWRSTNDCNHTAAPKNPMKAIVYCDYGLTNLKLENVEKPVPNDDQILVKVRAASVNPYDWHFIEGTPKILRLMGVGLRKPKDTRVGVDFAGTVEAVGRIRQLPDSSNRATKYSAGKMARWRSMYAGGPRAQVQQNPPAS